MSTTDSGPRAPRSSTRHELRSRLSKSHSRSVSLSSRSSRSRSRSRSRERASRSRRSPSLSASRKPRRSTRRSHRSRSRSASRDRSSRHMHRRHRDRDRERSRSRDRRRRESSRSSRKRSRRDRSRSTDRKRRSRRDSSPKDEDSTRDRRQRRRRDSDAVSSDKTTEETTTIKTQPTQMAVTNPVLEVQVEGLSKSTKIDAAVDVASQEKQDTPTSQESIATTTGTVAVSSQSDTEMGSKEHTTNEEPLKGEQESVLPVKSTVSMKKPSTVDVKSIKMDILKALADARSTIAGIKGAAPNPVATTDAPKTVPLAEEVQSRAPEKLGDPALSDENMSVPEAEDVEHKPSLPPPEVDVKSITPPKQQMSSADVDEFDMFTAAELHGAGMSPVAAPAPMVVGTAVQSNYDDADGYYKPNIGEVVNGKYRILGTVGKGVFSTVLRCQRVTSTSDDPEIVAIKLIRNNDIMREASETETKILTYLSERDPRDKKHCVRLLERFEHRNHVALVFESMQMNVREAMKKFGGKGGISIQAVRIFCKHLLVALSHLDACDIVHADIKPDNVLLDEKQTMIKLCDFGSAFELNQGKHDPTPYLVSRFYRAPEIVLGLPYDKAVDMWSVGCCLYEMFTGKVMFPGATNNEMLKLFMELKGKVPNKIIKKHRQAYIEQFQMEPHFTEDNKFCSHEIDRVTGKPVLRLMDTIKTRFDLGNALLSAKSSTDDRKQVLELRNLLERMFTLDASKRITPKEALAHPFVKTEGKPAT